MQTSFLYFRKKNYFMVIINYKLKKSLLIMYIISSTVENYNNYCIIVLSVKLVRYVNKLLLRRNLFHNNTKTSLFYKCFVDIITDLNILYILEHV